jgi:hypothetical protein
MIGLRSARPSDDTSTMTESLFYLTQRLLGYDLRTGEPCGFDSPNAVRVLDGERGKREMINGRLETVVRFRRAQPPAHEVEWPWYYAVQDIFDRSTVMALSAFSWLLDDADLIHKANCR